MLPPARIHGSCHRLQDKFRDKLAKGGEVLAVFLSGCKFQQFSATNRSASNKSTKSRERHSYVFTAIVFS